MPDAVGAPKARRIVVSAGDPSGDLILSKVIEELQKIWERERPGEKLVFEGLCGPACEALGVRKIASSHEVAVVGLVEVLRNLKRIFGVLGRLGDRLEGADGLICVDFPDFNLKLAEIARRKKVPVDYIIAPQVWAWRPTRVIKMRRLIRRIYPALPFEQQIFDEAGIDARYLGHPIRDLLPPKARSAVRKEFNFAPDDFVMCLLPGSRRSEITRHLPLMLEAWKQLPALQKRIGRKFPFRGILPLAPGWTEASLIDILEVKDRESLRDFRARGEWLLVNDSRKALMAGDFGWVSSGTATLEAALYGLPHILVYRLSGLSAFLIRRLTSYFDHHETMAGLPNILMEKKVIPELLQEELNARRLAIETIELLNDNHALANMKRSLRYLPKKLGEPGSTRRIAQDLAQLWLSK
jgi:lipid-A-disaccharide synthase